MRKPLEKQAEIKEARQARSTHIVVSIKTNTQYGNNNNNSNKKHDFQSVCPFCLLYKKQNNWRVRHFVTPNLSASVFAWQSAPLCSALLRSVWHAAADKWQVHSQEEATQSGRWDHGSKVTPILFATLLLGMLREIGFPAEVFKCFCNYVTLNAVGKAFPHNCFDLLNYIA